MYLLVIAVAFIKTYNFLYFWHLKKLVHESLMQICKNISILNRSARWELYVSCLMTKTAKVLFMIMTVKDWQPLLIARG